MTNKPRDKDGYIIYNWKRINAQVAETSKLTDIEFAEHAAKVRAQYDATPSISALAVLKKLLGR